MFWAGIPGLLFLLWAWWDSGAHTTQFWARGHGSDFSFSSEVSRGNVLVKYHPGSIPHSLSQWTLDGRRWRMKEEGLALRPGSAASAPRPRQFEVARAYYVEIEMDGLGKNPAAHGWVPSPGRTLPVAKLVRVEWQVAWWLLVLGYLMAGTLFIACWQYWKARRLERRGGPRAAISFRLWVPFILLLGLTACFLDSLQTRTRGWVGNGKYHVGCSHHRGLFIASFFHHPLAPDGLDLQWEIIRETKGDGELTPRRWPLWISPYPWSDHSSELRLPTTFTLGAFVVLWAGAACWRWRRQRARLRKLSPPPPQNG